MCIDRNGQVKFKHDKPCDYGYSSCAPQSPMQAVSRKNVGRVNAHLDNVAQLAHEDHQVLVQQIRARAI